MREGSDSKFVHNLATGLDVLETSAGLVLFAKDGMDALKSIKNFSGRCRILGNGGTNLIDDAAQLGAKSVDGISGKTVVDNVIEGGSKTSSEIAQSWQGTGKYPSIDTYKDITIKQDKIIYRGEPNGTEYFTTRSAIERSGYGANTVFEGLQVEKNPIHGYRSNMQGYKATVDLDAAFGITKANPQFGKGGLPQIFMPDANDLINKGYLVPVDNIPLKK